jgi:hypothetical protein
MPRGGPQTPERCDVDGITPARCYKRALQAAPPNGDVDPNGDLLDDLAAQLHADRRARLLAATPALDNAAAGFDRGEHVDRVLALLDARGLT